MLIVPTFEFAYHGDIDLDSKLPFIILLSPITTGCGVGDGVTGNGVGGGDGGGVTPLGHPLIQFAPQ